MDKQELKTFLNLIMASDPWPTSEEEHLTMLNFADKESKAHGFPDWITAFHELEL